MRVLCPLYAPCVAREGGRSTRTILTQTRSEPVEEVPLHDKPVGYPHKRRQLPHPVCQPVEATVCELSTSQSIPRDSQLPRIESRIHRLTSGVFDLKDRFDFHARAGWQRGEAQSAAGVIAITFFAKDLVQQIRAAVDN